MKNEKFKFILYVSHIVTCDALVNGRSIEKWMIREEARKLVPKLEFSQGTKRCLQSHLNGTLYDLLCRQGTRDENLDYFLDFVVDLANISVIDKGDKWLKLAQLIAKIIKKCKKSLFEHLVDPICPNEKPDTTKIRPKKVRRQFGVINTLHTLKSIFCEPIVVEGYAKELQDRYDKKFTAWALGFLGKAWCCLITGEWYSMIS